MRTYNDLRWHLGRSCEPKKLKNGQKVKWGLIDQPIDRPTKRLISVVLRKQMKIHFCTRHSSAPSHIKDSLGLSFPLSVALRLSVSHN